MRIGVYVGSFDPVHKGHIHVVNYLIENDYVDKVMIIPTKEYWDKKKMTDIKHRINMLKYYENDDIIIDENLNEIEYTYMILRELRKEYIDDTLCLIIGADNILNFHLWKNYDEILENRVLVLNRDDIDVDKYIEKFSNEDSFIHVKDFEYIDISSTYIRNCAKNKLIMELNEYLDHDVIDYIFLNKLYKESNYEENSR